MNDQKKEKRLLLTVIKGTIIRSILVMAAVTFVFGFVLGIAKVDSISMYPALRPGDIALYLRIGAPEHGMTVIYEADGKDYFGRVEATVGMKVSATEGGQLTIDGRMQPIQPRAGIYAETMTRNKNRIKYPSVVPGDSYLILGDDREQAVDSRDLGYITRKNIKGRIITILRRREL